MIYIINNYFILFFQVLQLIFILVLMLMYSRCLVIRFTIEIFITQLELNINKMIWIFWTCRYCILNSVEL